jgi:phasin family protein
MNDDMLANFTKMSTQYQSFLGPMIKANQLSAANLEMLVNFQMSTLQSYVDMAMSRMKTAAEISDPEGFQTFVSSQVETMASLNQKFLDDTKALADLMAKFKANFDQLAQESLSLKS